MKCSMKILKEYEGRLDRQISDLFTMFKERSRQLDSKVDFSEHIRYGAQ